MSLIYFKQEPDLAAIAKKEEENHTKAEERYREALRELKSQKLKDNERQNQWAASQMLYWWVSICWIWLMFLCLSADSSMPGGRRYSQKRKGQQKWPASHLLPLTSFRWFAHTITSMTHLTSQLHLLAHILVKCWFGRSPYLFSQHINRVDHDTKLKVHERRDALQNTESETKWIPKNNISPMVLVILS